MGTYLFVYHGGRMPSSPEGRMFFTPKVWPPVAGGGGGLATTPPEKIAHTISTLKGSASAPLLNDRNHDDNPFRVALLAHA